MKKICILVNDVTTLLQFRCELVVSLVEKGHEVIVSVPKHQRTTEIEALGAKVVYTDVARHGKNPIKDYKLYKEYLKLLKQLKPDIVFTFTVKPNVYGGMACGKLNIPYVANVTGLGVVGKKSLLQSLMLWLYKKGLKKAQCVFFQNQSNLDFFTKKKIVGKSVKLLPGSGVNLQKFEYLPYPSNDIIEFVFVGRIIREKGVYELAEVAKSLEGNDKVHFTIVGDVEFGAENPFLTCKNVTCVGFHKNVIPFLEKANAIILPSYHEGMANVLLEAASSGRPIIASNISGCKETFEEGKTGFGFSVKDVESLKNAVEKFLSLTDQERSKMGCAGREKMENEFDRMFVVNEYCAQLN